MDFSSLVLMERDAETKFFTKELGSYQVGEGAEYITKLYSENNIVHLYFSTVKDVEDWEYTAIFDNFNEGTFSEEGFEIEAIDEEFNPEWVVKFKYDEDHEVMAEAINTLCDVIKEELEKVIEFIKGKEDQYK